MLPVPIEATPTIYTVRDFLNWQRDGTLELRPPFQRYALWKPIAKSSLIDSLLRGYPIPALFLQDRTDSRSFHRQLVVVDGQQRLRTVLAFVDISCLQDADERDQFAILKVHDPDRAGQRFGDLGDADRDRILSTRMNVNIVGSSVAESELLEIFRRMNTYGSHLNAQELRNANKDGFFKEISYRLASESLDRWLAWSLFNRQEIAEMRDVEFTSDVLLLILRGTSSATKKVVDGAYDAYANDFPELDTCVSRFRLLRDSVDAVLSEGAETRRHARKMWAYSLFDALQRITWGGPISNTGPAKGANISAARIRAGCIRTNEEIESGALPTNVERSTRGAATDKGSREARAAYLLRALSQK